MTVRLGLIGVGRWGRNYVSTIEGLKDVELVALGGRGQWHEMIDRSLIDGVIVATPPRAHAEIALAALGAGIPVLVEKPFTLDLAQAQAVRDRSLQEGVLAMVGHTHLYHPAWRAMKARLSGPVREIRAEAGNQGPFRPDASVLWDWGPHDVAMCLDLLGEMPGEASATTVEEKEVEGGRGEIVEINLQFASASAALRVGNLMPEKRRVFTVRSDSGELAYDDPPSEERPLTVLVREFAEAIIAGRSSDPSLELGVRVVEVLARCAASGK